MSTGSAPPVTEVGNGMEDIFATMAAQQIEDMQKQNTDFQQRMNTQHAAVENSVEKILAKMTGKKGIQYTPEITNIANVLMAFPGLVPVVTSIINKIQTEMATKFAEVASKYTEPTPPPTGGSGT